MRGLISLQVTDSVPRDECVAPDLDRLLGRPSLDAIKGRHALRMVIRPSNDHEGTPTISDRSNSPNEFLILFQLRTVDPMVFLTECNFVSPALLRRIERAVSSSHRLSDGFI